MLATATQGVEERGLARIGVANQTYADMVALLLNGTKHNIVFVVDDAAVGLGELLRLLAGHHYDHLGLLAS